MPKVSHAPKRPVPPNITEGSHPRRRAPDLFFVDNYCDGDYAHLSTSSAIRTRLRLGLYFIASLSDVALSPILADHARSQRAELEQAPMALDDVAPTLAVCA